MAKSICKRIDSAYQAIPHEAEISYPSPYPIRPHCAEPGDLPASCDLRAIWCGAVSCKSCACFECIIQCDSLPTNCTFESDFVGFLESGACCSSGCAHRAFSLTKNETAQSPGAMFHSW